MYHVISFADLRNTEGVGSNILLAYPVNVTSKSNIE